MDDGTTRAGPLPMSPAADLYGFAAEQPAWQGELIRRIYERGAVQEQDVADGVKMVRQSEGLQPADGPALAPLRPIAPQNTPVDPSVRLLGVSDLVSVNRLPRGAWLRFAESGLTVVYGDNGSGKSGYCRVIKAACGGGPVVLPDVFAPGPDTTSATITYSVDGIPDTFAWTAGAVHPDSLARVTVFDAVRAPLYVDEERRLGFLPRGLEVLPALGRILTAMGEQFDADLRLAAAGIPTIGVQAPPETSVRQLLDRLVPGATPPSDVEIDAIAHLTVDERSELTQLESSFRRDPAATAGRLENLAVRPADRTERGEHLVSIALDADMRVRVREVLSDGEIRAVGLAGFLADCRRIGASPPIVLDDPVSSLDHQRIRAVAVRLVDESKRRQVIVFTHSILFLWELWDRAVAQQVALAPHWLRVEGGTPGALTEDTVPWGAAGVGTMLGGLDQRLATARRIGDLAGEQYRGAVRLYYGDLRDTWERLVEELLLNGVIGRFTPGVHTRQLRKVEVTDEDFKIIDTNMTRASQFEHSQALGREQSLPTHAEMESDLRALRNFRDAIRARLETVDRRRQVAQRPSTT